MNLDDILKRFANPQRHNKGFKVRCPTHDDNRNSLNIAEGDTGKILIHCLAGCLTKDVIGAVGLTWKDLAGTSSTGHERHASDPVVAHYTYVDEAGNPLFEVCRTQSKEFFQSRFDAASGKFIHGMDGTRRVPYHLPAVIAAENVFIVEGEKDADVLSSLGFCATTNPGGAGHWHPSYNSFFHQKNVVILPDNDGPGKAHGNTIANALRPIANSVKVVLLPDLPRKGDVSYFLDRHSKDELLDIINANRTGSTAKTAQVINSIEWPEFVTAKDILAAPNDPTRWILEGCLPVGGTSVLVAKPKVGKTTIAADLAISVARGEPFLGRATQQSPVAYVFLDGPQSDITETFVRLGVRESDPIYIHAGGVPSNDIEWILHNVRTKGVRLVIIDVLQKYCRFTDINDYSEVISKMGPLLQAAQDGRCHIMMLHHARKDSTDDLDSAIGSTAIRGQVYSYLFAKRLPKSDQRILSSDQRGGKNFGEIGIGFDTDTGRLCVQGTIDDVEGAAAMPLILQILENSDPQREDELRNAIPMRASIVGKALREHLKNGSVIRTGAGTRGKAYRYSLASPTSGRASLTLTPGNATCTYVRPEGKGTGEEELGLESDKQTQLAEKAEKDCDPDSADCNRTNGTSMDHNPTSGRDCEDLVWELSADWNEASLLRTKSRETLQKVAIVKGIFLGAKVIH